LSCGLATDQLMCPPPFAVTKPSTLREAVNLSEAGLQVGQPSWASPEMVKR
jgi:hypothetical protein